MNYARIYYEIIEKRQKDPITEGYSENHHIKPKSLGGSDNPDNLVRLTAREHFVCHYLLAKIYKRETNEWYKMNHAFMMMKCDSIYNDRYFNSRLYEALKGDFSSVMSFAQKGKKNSQHGTCWICDLKNEENKKIPKQDLELWETKGWVKGRNKWNEIVKQNEVVFRKRKVVKLKEEKTILYSRYYTLYREVGFEDFVNETGYEFSKQNLVKQFNIYVEDFIPQNGKMRKIVRV